MINGIFRLTERGEIEVKGKGAMRTYYVVGTGGCFHMESRKIVFTFPLQKTPRPDINTAKSAQIRPNPPEYNPASAKIHSNICFQTTPVSVHFRDGTPITVIFASPLHSGRTSRGRHGDRGAGQRARADSDE